MNIPFLSHTIHSGADTTAHTPSSGGSAPGHSLHSQHAPITIVRIGTRPGRHHLRINHIVKNLKEDSLVVLAYDGNYCDYDWAAISSHPDGEHLPKVNFGDFRETYTAIIPRILSTGVHIALLTLPSLLPQRYFDHVSRNLNRNAILQWLGGDVCNLNRWQEQYNEEILSLAAHYNIPVVDINPSFLQRHYIESCYRDDGMHPNTTGQTVISELVASWQSRAH
jgi:hypothetical protein